MSAWVVAVFAYVLLAVWLLGIRPDLAAQLRDVGYVVELALCLAAACLAGVGAVLSSVPGFNSAPQKAGVVLLPAAPAVLLLAYGGFEPGAMGASFAANHLPVTAMLVALAAPPALWLGWIGRRAAPTHLGLTGALVLLAGGMCAYVVLRLAMADNNLANVVVWCYLPLALLVACGVPLGRKLLRW